MTIFSKQFNRRIAFVSALFFLLESAASSHQLLANSSPVVLEKSTKGQLHLSTFTIPTDIATIQEKFQGSSSESVIIIQDAHDIPEAQKNIFQTIRQLLDQYEIELVGLEGAEGVLDNQFYQSFPDQNKLKKNIEDWMRRGELSGGTAAAILEKTPTPFVGIEEERFYQEGIILYRKALSQLERYNQKKELADKRLKVRKEKILPKELIKVDWLWTQFQENHASLDKLLREMFRLSNPKTPYLKALKENIFSESTQKQDRLVEAALRELKAKISESANNSSESRQFHTLKQSYETGASKAQKTAYEIRRFIEEHSIPFAKLNELERISNNEEKLNSLEGIEFFKELEIYYASIYEKYCSTKECKELKLESEKSILSKKLANLEISRSEYESLIKYYPEILQSQPSPSAFYKNAAARENMFVNNLRKFKTKKQSHRASVVVIGGFHAEGLIKKFKQEGVSFVLLSPKMTEVDGEHRYREHMMGNVTWAGYFKDQTGDVPLYKAFARAVRDGLVKQNLQSPFANSQEELKLWRDKLVMSLVESRKTSAVGNYTNLLDESLSQMRLAHLEHRKDLFEDFLGQLEALHNSKQFSVKTISRLLSKYTIPSEVTGPKVLSWPSLRQARSEVRTASRGDTQKSVVPSQLTKERLLGLLKSGDTRQLLEALKRDWQSPDSPFYWVPAANYQLFESPANVIMDVITAVPHAFQIKFKTGNIIADAKRNINTLTIIIDDADHSISSILLDDPVRPFYRDWTSEDAKKLKGEFIFRQILYWFQQMGFEKAVFSDTVFFEKLAKQWTAEGRFLQGFSPLTPELSERISFPLQEMNLGLVQNSRSELRQKGSGDVSRKKSVRITSEGPGLFEISEVVNRDSTKKNRLAQISRKGNAASAYGPKIATSRSEARLDLQKYPLPSGLNLQGLLQLAKADKKSAMGWKIWKDWRKSKDNPYGWVPWWVRVGVSEAYYRGATDKGTDITVSFYKWGVFAMGTVTFGFNRESELTSLTISSTGNNADTSFYDAWGLKGVEVARSIFFWLQGLGVESFSGEANFWTRVAGYLNTEKRDLGSGVSGATTFKFSNLDLHPEHTAPARSELRQKGSENVSRKKSVPIAFEGPDSFAIRNRSLVFVIKDSKNQSWVAKISREGEDAPSREWEITKGVRRETGLVPETLRINISEDYRTSLSRKLILQFQEKIEQASDDKEEETLRATRDDLLKLLYKTKEVTLVKKSEGENGSRHVEKLRKRFLNGELDEKKFLTQVHQEADSILKAILRFRSKFNHNDLALEEVYFDRKDNNVLHVLDWGSSARIQDDQTASVRLSPALKRIYVNHFPNAAVLLSSRKDYQRYPQLANYLDLMGALIMLFEYFPEYKDGESKAISLRRKYLIQKMREINDEFDRARAAIDARKVFQFDNGETEARASTNKQLEALQDEWAHLTGYARISAREMSIGLNNEIKVLKLEKAVRSITLNIGGREVPLKSVMAERERYLTTTVSEDKKIIALKPLKGLMKVNIDGKDYYVPKLIIDGSHLGSPPAEPVSKANPNPSAAAVVANSDRGKPAEKKKPEVSEADRLWNQLVTEVTSTPEVSKLASAPATPQTEPEAIKAGGGSTETRRVISEPAHRTSVISPENVSYDAEKQRLFLKFGENYPVKFHQSNGEIIPLDEAFKIPGFRWEIDYRQRVIYFSIIRREPEQAGAVFVDGAIEGEKFGFFMPFKVYSAMHAKKVQDASYKPTVILGVQPEAIIAERQSFLNLISSFLKSIASFLKSIFVSTIVALFPDAQDYFEGEEQRLAGIKRIRGFSGFDKTVEESPQVLPLSDLVHRYSYYMNQSIRRIFFRGSSDPGIRESSIFDQDITQQMQVVKAAIREMFLKLDSVPVNITPDYFLKLSNEQILLIFNQIFAALNKESEHGSKLTFYKTHQTPIVQSQIADFIREIQRKQQAVEIINYAYDWFAYLNELSRLLEGVEQTSLSQQNRPLVEDIKTDLEIDRWALIGFLDQLLSKVESLSPDDSARMLSEAKEHLREIADDVASLRASLATYRNKSAAQLTSQLPSLNGQVSQNPVAASSRSEIRYAEKRVGGKEIPAFVHLFLEGGLNRAYAAMLKKAVSSDPDYFFRRARQEAENYLKRAQKDQSRNLSEAQPEFTYEMALWSLDYLAKMFSPLVGNNLGYGVDIAPDSVVSFQKMLRLKNVPGLSLLFVPRNLKAVGDNHIPVQLVGDIDAMRRANLAISNPDVIPVLAGGQGKVYKNSRLLVVRNDGALKNEPYFEVVSRFFEMLLGGAAASYASKAGDIAHLRENVFRTLNAQLGNTWKQGGNRELIVKQEQLRDSLAQLFSQAIASKLASAAA